jgi:hypothetical protein
MTTRKRRSTRRGDSSRRQGDEAAGTSREESPIGSVTGTDHQKGPCDSYSQGPFADWGVFAYRVVASNVRLGAVLA